jgi:hypothetical protein
MSPTTKRPAKSVVGQKMAAYKPLETPGANGGEPQPPDPNPSGSWTILLDIAADGLLANFGVESLKQLKNSTSKIGGLAGLLHEMLNQVTGPAPVSNGLPERLIVELASQIGSSQESAFQPLVKAAQTSLNKLKSAASTETLGTVKVAAQFSVDAPAGQKIPRYIFGPDSSGSLVDCIADNYEVPPRATDKDVLQNFLMWALHDPNRGPELKSDHYALILWGHGPDLLLQPPPAPKHDSVSPFLSPIDLGAALAAVLSQKLPNGADQFDVIGFDACSMSMFELAYQIKRHSVFMVASQEEVPDLSFPYDTIVALFQDKVTRIEKKLRRGAYAYIKAYQDYIDGEVTMTKPATLSALRLNRCAPLKDALCKLCCALQNARGEAGLASVLIRARENARDFVSGLYVDLYDFASALINVLDAGANSDLSEKCSGSLSQSVPACWRCRIRAACIEIGTALKTDPNDDQSFLVLANRSADATCHGISLYMPYLSANQFEGITRPMVKGGDRTSKDAATVLNDTAPQQLMWERRQLIADTEHYYEDLQLSQDTGWYRFLVRQWTPILVNNGKQKLDLLYSAEQAAVNACRGPENPIKLTAGLCPTYPTDCS